MDNSAEQLPQNDDHNDNDVASTSMPKAMDSPKTPVRRPLDDSLEEFFSDEMESPQFPHLIPVYNRRHLNDLDDVRIGWDDGFGSVCYEDDDFGAEKNGRRFKRSKSGRLFTERHHHSLMRSRKNIIDSPSPNHSSNNAVIQAELNDYLGCILSCLSAKKKNRQLVKSSKCETTSNTLEENYNVSNLLNDSTEDEVLMLCSQAVEKTISFDANYNTVESNTLVKSNCSSIVGISPLKSTDCTSNSNSYQPSIKKFKPEIIEVRLTDSQIDEKIKNSRSRSYTVTSNSKNKFEKETNNCSLSSYDTVTVTDKDSFLDDSLAKDDDLFSALDLSAIEQQVLSTNNESTSVSTQIIDPVSTKQHKNSTILNGSNGKNNFKSSTSYNPSSSVLWRRCSSSSSVINNKLQSKHNKPIGSDSVKDTVIITKPNVNTGNTRYCTAAEIEEKRNRARRTLMLKFKSKNKSSL